MKRSEMQEKFRRQLERNREAMLRALRDGEKPSR